MMDPLLHVERHQTIGADKDLRKYSSNLNEI